MRFLIFLPWKLVVLVWGLLTAMIFIGFTASSVLQGTDHSSAPALAVKSTQTKSGSAHAVQQPKHAQTAAQTRSYQMLPLVISATTLLQPREAVVDRLSDVF